MVQPLLEILMLCQVKVIVGGTLGYERIIVEVLAQLLLVVLLLY